MVLSAPGGTGGEAALPVPDRGVVVVDGRRAWGRGAKPGSAHWDERSRRIIVTGLGAGEHVITWAPAP
jgi:hypothetical protein